MKPFTPEEIKTFRAPKYGGVTLSLLSMFVLASMIVVWNKIGEQGQEQFNQSIRVLCDESVSAPVKECAEQFEREMKVKVSIHSTPGPDRNRSMANETLNPDPYDLDLSAGKPIEKVPSLNQVSCAFRSVVFATRNDFSQDMTELEQVFQNNLTYSTSADSTEEGRLLEHSLGKTNLWRKILSKRTKTYPSSKAAALQVASGKDLDGAFMWDFSARAFGLKIHRIKELKPASQTFFARTSNSSQNRLSALQFGRFLSAPTKGQFYFAKAGFVGVNGDAWTEQPSLYVYCAKAIENSMLDDFERFESEVFVSIEPHFINEDKMALSLSLIAQSKAQKALPDLVLGIPQTHDLQVPAQFLKSEALLVNDNEISVYFLRSSRFPVSSRKFRDFLLLKETKSRISLDI